MPTVTEKINTRFFFLDKDCFTDCQVNTDKGIIYISEVLMAIQDDFSEREKKNLLGQISPS